MTTVHLPSALTEAMIAHAQRDAPREACGLVASDSDGNLVHVYALANVDPHPDRFVVDPRQHFSTIRSAEATGWTVAGVYHSHPRGPGGPSATDRAAPLDSTWISFVIAPASGRWGIRAFHIRQGVATELQVVEAPSNASLL